MLSMQVKTYVEVHDLPTDKLKGLGALGKFITETYKVCFNILNCQTIESLELLWNDTLSGHLDKVAEQYLVTSEMKQRLNLEKVKLKATIEEENYLNCRKVLTGCSGEYKYIFGQSNNYYGRSWQIDAFCISMNLTLDFQGSSLY